MYLLLNHSARGPERLFRNLAAAVLLLSLTNPLFLLGIDNPRFATDSWVVFAALLVLHAVVAAVTARELTRGASDQAG